MPSEDRIEQALSALAGARETFLSSVALSAEEVRGHLERETDSQDKPGERLAHELGPMGAARIDLERLAPFVSGNRRLDPEKRTRAEEALEVLRSIRKAGDETFKARCELDGYLRGSIIEGLGRAGRAFGAARTVEAIFTGIPQPEVVKNPLESFPPHHWNRGEKGCAPPLVVEVEGQDVRAASLGELLEGTQKIVLVVNGPAAPAPLIRLLTPGVTVIQTDDPDDLAALAATPGPGIAALMPEGAARFVHVGGAGKTLDQRLDVKSVPEKDPKRPLGAISVFQQTEELHQLRSLARSIEPAAVEREEGVEEEAPAMDDAGQLAAWLIQQANLSES